MLRSFKKKSKSNNSLFNKVNKNIFNIFNKNPKFINLKSEISKMSRDSSKKEIRQKRLNYISRYNKKSIIRKLYINKKTLSNIISNNFVEYIGYNLKSNKLYETDSGIANGTWINSFENKCITPLVNIYKTKLTINNQTIESIRYGTAIKCPHKTDIISNVLKQLTSASPLLTSASPLLTSASPLLSSKKILNFSLLSHCSGLCKITSNLLGHGPLAKISESLIYEPLITKDEQKLDIDTIFIPLSAPKHYGVLDINNYKYIKVANERVSNNSGNSLKNFIKLLDFSNIYKSLIMMFIYYFLYLKEEYTICVSCKAAKERTSIFDALFKSVMTVSLMKSLKNDKSLNNIYNEIIDDVEKWFPEYLKIGFVIGFYSTGLTGLKLKNIAIIEDISRILGPNYDFFLGFQEYIN